MQIVLRLERAGFEADVVYDVGEYGDFAGQRHLRSVGIFDARGRRLVRPGAGDDRSGIALKLCADRRRLGPVIAQTAVHLGELGGVFAARVIGRIESRLTEVVNNPSTIAVKVTRSEIASCTSAIDCADRCPSGRRGWTKKPTAELAHKIANRSTELIGFCMRRLAIRESRHGSTKKGGAQEPAGLARSLGASPGLVSAARGEFAAVARQARQPANPSPAKPMSIIVQVAGSGARSAGIRQAPSSQVIYTVDRCWTRPVILRGVAGELGLGDVAVGPPLRQELDMSAALDDPTAVDDADFVGLSHRRQPVGDDDRGPALAQRA